MELSPAAFGIRTTSDLHDAGLSWGAIRSSAMTGTLARIRRGYYVSENHLTPEERHLGLVAAALREVGDGAVLSHVSAGLLHGLPVPRTQLDRVTMTRTSPGHGNHGRHVIIRATPLEAVDIAMLGEVRVTSLARTTADLARLLPFEWGVAAADAALAAGLTQPSLNYVMHRHRGLKGLPLGRRVVEFADPRAESPAESISRVHLARLGVPPPVPQFVVRDAKGNEVARCDFGWPEQRVVGEVDGKVKYDELLRPGRTAADAVLAEKHREAPIRDCGYWIVRWTWEDLQRPVTLARRVQRALRWRHPA